MQARIAPTATMLANVKAIKMIGLDKVISKSLQEVHSNELQHFKAFKFWFVVTMASGIYITLSDCLVAFTNLHLKLNFCP